MDYAAEFDWPGYFAAVEGKPARETLVKALELFELEDVKAGKPVVRVALDFGCGEGRDTRELLRRSGPTRWSLMATDGSAKGLEILRGTLPPGEAERVTFVESLMEQLPGKCKAGIRHGAGTRAAKQIDLVNASFSLPFCAAKDLPRVWAWMTGLIRPGGRFAGQIFGDRDTWAHARKTTGISRAKVDKMFSGFIFDELREEEKDDVTTMGEPKHWHVFHVVARKRA